MCTVFQSWMKYNQHFSSSTILDDCFFSALGAVHCECLFCEGFMCRCLRTWPNLEFQTQSVSSLYRGCNAELFCACWPIHSLHMWIAPFVRASCSWLSLDVCREESEMLQMRLLLILSGLLNVWMDVKMSSSDWQELMGSTLQVGSVHCFRFICMTLQWVTQLHIYLQTQVSKTYKFGLFLQQCFWLQTIKQSYPSFVLYISNVFISLRFCAFLWVIKGCLLHALSYLLLSFKGIVHQK